MNTAGKNRAERDPKEYNRTPQSTLHRAEDRAKACNIQQLNQKEFPLRHNNVVNAVVDAHSRSFTVIRTESVVDNFTICKITDNQESQTKNEA